MTANMHPTGPLALLRTLQVVATLQLGLGLAFWSGHGYRFLPLHMIGGIVFVILIWTIAALALRHRRRAGLSILMLFWGLALPILGLTQQRLLPGDMHWSIRLLHLALGVAVMPLAALVNGSAASAAGTGTPSRR